MSLPDKTTILIVGAGPAGLATAVALIHHGCRDFVIVDAVMAGKNSSRAIIVHASTLEVLDTIGCGDAVASQGTKASSFKVGTRSDTLLQPPITESLKPYTRHPYILLIPQTLTEDALEGKLASLGVTIHRPLRVVGIKQNAGNPQLSDITFEDGKVITTRYVVGADGAHSTVRSLAGIGFSDPMASIEKENNLAQMVLGDVTFDGADLDGATTSGTLSPHNFFVVFPLPLTYNKYLATHGGPNVSGRLYRIVCGIPLEEGEIPHSPDKKYFQKVVDRFGPLGLSSDPSMNPNLKPTLVKDVVWSSRFRNSSSIADTVFKRLDSGEG